MVRTDTNWNLPFFLQTITTAPMLSIGGECVSLTQYSNQLNKRRKDDVRYHVIKYNRVETLNNVKMWNLYDIQKTRSTHRKHDAVEWRSTCTKMSVMTHNVISMTKKLWRSTAWRPQLSHRHTNSPLVRHLHHLRMCASKQFILGTNYTKMWDWQN